MRITPRNPHTAELVDSTRLAHQWHDLRIE